MGYYINFQSFKDSIGSSVSFIVVVTMNDGKVMMSSGIPIVVLDEVMSEIELANMGSVGFSMWVQKGNSEPGNGSIVTFPIGSIKKIELQFF